MMDDLPSNSHKSSRQGDEETKRDRSSRRPIIRVDDETENETPEKKIEKVVSGKVIRRKKSLGSRVKNALLGDDSTGVLRSLVMQGLLPALQEAAVRFFHEGVDRVFHDSIDRIFNPDGQDVRSRSSSYRRPPVTRTHVSYDSYSSSRPSSPRPGYGSRRPQIYRSSAMEMDEIIVESKLDANAILVGLGDIIEEYGVVAVADLKELLAEDPEKIERIDHRYGWKDLSSAGVRRVREGYQIILPDPEALR